MTARTRPRSAAEIESAIERWANGDGPGVKIYEYLGWTFQEYMDWLETNFAPYVNDA